MDNDILNQLETIRVYVFIIMAGTLVWILLNVVGVIQRLFIDFKKARDNHFINSMNEQLDKGKYNDVISECEKVLGKYPYHAQATWFMAKSYYLTNDVENSIKHFKEAVRLVPEWEDDASAYIDYLNNHIKIFNKE